MTSSRRDLSPWLRAVPLTMVAAGIPAVASAQIQLRRGAEFQVNAYTTGLQWQPAVAVGPDGDFLVAWSSKAGAGDAQTIMARRFHLSGAPIGPELVVSTATAVEQRTPAVTATRDGEFVVVWSGGHVAAGDGVGIFGRVIDASGQLVGPEFLVNEFTPGAQWEPAIAADAQGNITVAWSGDGGHDFDGVSARRLTHRGEPLTPQVEVNTWIAGVQSRPAVASTPEGDFTVLWQGAPADRVQARRFTAEGTPIMGQFEINTHMDADSGPAAACDADGNVFIASTGIGADGDGAGVNGLRMLPNGGFDAGEFMVNSYTTGSQSAPSVAEHGGSFVVVWTSGGQDGNFEGVHGQRYDADLQRIGTEFRVNSYTTNQQWEPAIASDAKGNWVVVWTSGPAGRDGSGPFHPITDGPHFIEFDWKRARTPESKDGALSMWIDDVSVGGAQGLDNNLGGVDFVRMGAISVKAGASGTLYWDHFRSRRLSRLGPW